jgi:hypothetical protein
VKKALSLISFVLLATAVAAAEAPTSPTNLVAERAVREFIGNCPGTMTFTFKPYEDRLPSGFRGTRVEVASDNSQCGGSYVNDSAPNEDYFVGNPWPIAEYEGTPEAKLKRFAWDRLKEGFEPLAHRDQTKNGLFRVELFQATEHGKVPLSGYVDPKGTSFFLGNFFSAATPPAQQRLAQIASVAKNAPTLGKADAKVTIYEFSDF